MVNPSTGVSTVPVRPSYIGFVHTDNSGKLEALENFTPVEKYPSQRDVLSGEIGERKGVRYIETSNAKIFAGEGGAGIDVYSILIFGQHAYGITRVEGKALENIVHALGSAGSADALNQRETSGWKATFLALILNNNFMARVEFADEQKIKT